MRASTSLTALAAAGALLFGAVACGDDDGDAATSDDSSSGSDSNGDSSGSPAIEITSPSDGDEVGGSFDVSFASSEELGPTDTGRHHVHLFFDGSDDYEVVESESFTVDTLDEGEHTIKAALANADHSLTGDETEISVTVGSGGGAPAGDSDSTDDPYDY